MPFRSKAQVRALFAKAPKVAKRWKQKYGIPDDLPERIHGAKYPTSADKPKKRRKGARYPR